MSKLLRPERPLLQLLTHPIWWADEHRLPEDNLQELFESETQGQPPEYIKAWDAALANTLSTVRRRGFSSGVQEGTE